MIFKPLPAESPGTIYRLLNESYRKFLSGNPHCSDSWQSDWRAYDRDVFSHPGLVGKCGFISYANGGLVGFASFDPRKGPSKAVIGHNCVRPHFRGNGFGRLQMRELLRRLRQRGFKKAVVSTGGHEFFSPAIAMYKRCGFRETGRIGTDPMSGLRSVELECDLSVVIRKAEHGDFGRVIALFKQLWPGKPLNRKRQEIVYKTMLKSRDYELLCAERKGKVIGFASVSIQHNFWQEGRIAYVTTLIVDKACRSQGVGSMLVDEMAELAGMQGCSKLELDSAFHRHDAHGFYVKSGFDRRAYLFSKDLQVTRFEEKAR